MDNVSEILNAVGESKLNNLQFGEMIGLFITARKRTEDDAIEVLNSALFFILNYFSGDPNFIKRRKEFESFLSDSVKMMHEYNKNKKSKGDAKWK